MIISGTPDISIIQGDNYEKKLYFTNIDINLIDSVFFSCKVLNLSKKLAKIDTGYFLLSFTQEETANYVPLTGNYDITVVFTDNKKKTVLYNSFIEILPKTNTVQEDSNE